LFIDSEEKLYINTIQDVQFFKIKFTDKERLPLHLEKMRDNGSRFRRDP
jgi:hypothetical protein